MRDRTKECTNRPGAGPAGEVSGPAGASNAFSPVFLERLREEDHPPTPEVASAGPWSVRPVERCGCRDRSSRLDTEEPGRPSSVPENRSADTPAGAAPARSNEPGAVRAPAEAPVPGVTRRGVSALESPTLQSRTEWVCLAAGEAGPRGAFERPDLAYLFAAALAVDAAPRRLRLGRRALEDCLAPAGGGAPGWHRLREDGRPVGRLAGCRPELVILADTLVHLRSRPLALAHFLAACGEETLERTGRILDGLVREGVS